MKSGTKKDVIVQPATDPATRERAFAVRQAVFVVEQNIPVDVEFDGLDDVSDHLLALADGRAVGTLRLRRIDDALAKIERVAVLEDTRGLGVGAALMRYAIAHLRDQGCEEAALHAQTHALDFYGRLGFAAYGPVFDEDGIPHKAMRRML